MESWNEIDVRINRIWNKMEKLSVNLEFSCGSWPPQWQAPLSEEELARFEKEKGIRLPEDYRRFITTKASGGTQPFYGLYSPLKPKPSYELEPIPEKPFPFTFKKPLVIAEMTEEEWNVFYNDKTYSFDTGYLLLCTEGCGMNSILIVNADDSETYGTVWFYDLANDYGIIPLLHPGDGRPFSFLDWLEYWVDFTVEHKEDEYFSYGEMTELLVAKE